MSSERHTPTPPLPDEGPAAEQASDGGVPDYIPTVHTDPRDITALGELAEAERAAARHASTPAQTAGLRAVGRARRPEERLARWRSDRETSAPGTDGSTAP